MTTHEARGGYKTSPDVLMDIFTQLMCSLVVDDHFLVDLIDDDRIESEEYFLPAWRHVFKKTQDKKVSPKTIYKKKKKNIS